MSLFFITGISGSGKSEVCKELKSRGYEAYDTDEDGLAKWQHNITGYIHPKSSVKKEDRTEAFLKNHSWNVPRHEVAELADRSNGKNVFLCGVSANENEIWDLFKAVFALVVDDDTLKHRLMTRTNNDWGKQPHELQQTMEWQRDANKMYEKFGHIRVDASKPVSEVVDTILDNALS